jgi:HAMP domain-containing protein
MVEEFFAALAQQYEAGRPTVSMPEPIRLPAERQRAIDAAKRRLQAAGV